MSGHYCKVCGEYKANEKFTGRGHATHICKKCASLPATEKAEMESTVSTICRHGSMKLNGSGFVIGRKIKGPQSGSWHRRKLKAETYSRGKEVLYGI